MLASLAGRNLVLQKKPNQAPVLTAHADSSTEPPSLEPTGQLEQHSEQLSRHWPLHVEILHTQPLHTHLLEIAMKKRYLSSSRAQAKVPSTTPIPLSSFSPSAFLLPILRCPLSFPLPFVNSSFSFMFLSFSFLVP